MRFPTLPNMPKGLIAATCEVSHSCMCPSQKWDARADHLWMCSCMKNERVHGWLRGCTKLRSRPQGKLLNVIKFPLGVMCTHVVSTKHDLMEGMFYFYLVIVLSTCCVNIKSPIQIPLIHERYTLFQKVLYP